jgi:NAD(P)-dependent dehydrogenase (short-subunit alcohol dehydrogenase family)
LHDKGYRIAICDLEEKARDGEQLADSLNLLGGTAMFVQCDVRSYTSQKELFRQVWIKWKRLDVVIANAGCVDRESVYNFDRRNVTVEDLPPEPDLSCTDIDFKGVVYGTTLATHFMRHNPHRKGGQIIVTGSMIGIYPCATFPVILFGRLWLLA